MSMPRRRGLNIVLQFGGSSRDCQLTVALSWISQGMPYSRSDVPIYVGRVYPSMMPGCTQQLCGPGAPIYVVRMYPAMWSGCTHLRGPAPYLALYTDKHCNVNGLWNSLTSLYM